MLHFSQLFSDYSPIALPPSRPSGGEAGIPVTALLDQKGDMLLGSGDSLRNSLAVILENIRPIIETLPLEQAADAYARMIQGKARFRMVLVTKDGVAQEASVNG